MLIVTKWNRNVLDTPIGLRLPPCQYNLNKNSIWQFYYHESSLLVGIIFYRVRDAAMNAWEDRILCLSNEAQFLKVVDTKYKY